MKSVPEPGGPLVSVLVLSRLRPDRLRALLACVLAQDFASKEVRVLANGDAQTAELVRAEFPSVVLFESAENVGCVAGRNRLAADARGEFLVFLDDDGELRATDSIAKLVAAARSDAKVGVVSCALYDAASDEPTGWRRTMGKLAYRCYHASFAGGACLMRKRAFDEAGRYDEAFRGFGEEFDLTVRLYAAGWAVLHFPEVAFHHHVEKTDAEWQAQMSEGYAHLQFTVWRLYPAPWCLAASMKALATQLWIDVRHHAARHLFAEAAKSRVWARAGRRARRPVAKRALELLYFAKYFRVETWDVLETAPRGLLRRVLLWRLRRKRLGVGKLPLPDRPAAADTPRG